MTIALCVSTTVVALGDASPFYMGGDISLETFIQQQVANAGGQFTDGGVAAPMDQIMYDHGANMFRLRIFVNPQTTYTNSNTGAIQTAAYDIALAQQIKADAPGAKILLDFHYSDTWADPGHQTKPSSWATAASISDLETNIQAYTTQTLTSFQSAGVMPDMVQIGNETTDGMLWQTGSSGASAVGGKILFQNTTYTGLGLPNNKPTQAQTNQSWQNFGGLLNAAISGVRAAQSPGQRIPVALSIDGGELNGQPQFFYGNITSPSLGNVTDFDVEGVDYYPSTGNSQKTFAFLQSNLTALANTNTNNGTNLNPSKKIMLLETNYPYTGSSNAIPMWETGGVSTPAQQEAEWVAVRNLMMTLPGHDGEGLLYWYPEAVQVPGYNIYKGGTISLFDATNSHNAQPVLTDNTFAPIRGDFNGDGHFNASDIAAMVNALSDLSDYQTNRGFTNPDMKFLGDFDGDGVITNADLQGMLDALLAGQGSTDPVPEPAAGWLLGVAAVAVLIRSRRKCSIEAATQPST